MIAYSEKVDLLIKNLRDDKPGTLDNFIDEALGMFRNVEMMKNHQDLALTLASTLCEAALDDTDMESARKATLGLYSGSMHQSEKDHASWLNDYLGPDRVESFADSSTPSLDAKLSDTFIQAAPAVILYLMDLNSHKSELYNQADLIHLTTEYHAKVMASQQNYQVSEKHSHRITIDGVADEYPSGNDEQVPYILYKNNREELCFGSYKDESHVMLRSFKFPFSNKHETNHGDLPLKM